MTAAPASAAATEVADSARRASAGFVVPMLTLLQREAIRFLRQRSRVFGALGQPVIFWLLLGSGLGGSFAPPGSTPGTSSYLSWFFPGIVAMVVLFTAIFSTISVIEDRKAGFLQAVLVAPVSRLSIVCGKILGGTLLGVGQGGLLLLALPFLGETPGLAALGLAFLALTGMAFALTGVGLCLAWRMESTQGFHMVMNLFLLPMWLLSGAFFPLEGTPPWLHLVMELNPLTYGVAALRHALAGPAPGQPSLALSLAVTGLFAAAAAVTAAALVRSRQGAA